MKTDRNEMQLQYKKRIKNRTRLIQITQLSILILFFSGWELAAAARWIDPLLFSSPSRILDLFIVRSQDGSLFLHTSVTLFETILGFLLGTFLGTCIAALLWWSPFLSRVLDPYLVILNSMPKVALGPILIVGLGPGFTSIIAMGVLISLVITTMVIYHAFKEVDDNYLKVIK